MPEAVVQLLEVVEVEHDERDGAPVALRGGDLLAESLVEVRAVPDPGERVHRGPRREQVVESLGPERSTHARTKLGRIERLGHVVDGAQIEALHLRVDLGSAREKDHRARLGQRVLLQLLADLEARDEGKLDIEEDEIGPKLSRHGQPFRRVEGVMEDQPLGLEANGEEAMDVGRVVDGEDGLCHGFSRRMGGSQAFPSSAGRRPWLVGVVSARKGTTAPRAA